MIGGCSFIQPSEEKPLEQGNTNGNIKQMGYAVEKDGWIYYCDGDGNGKHELKDRLFKKKIDGSQKQNLSKNLAYQINVVGNYVYYISGEPGPIYKINKNGGFSRKLERKRSSNLIVIGDTIFYRREYQGLYRMDINGNRKKKLADNILEFSIYENTIYYTDQGDDCFYSMDLNGRNVKKINNDHAKDINIEDGWIYYWDFNDSKIYKLRLDGSEKHVICSDICRNLNLHNAVLYYRNQSGKPKELSIYKINVDGTERKKLIQGNIVNINIVGDFLLYYRIGEGDYRANLDGSNEQKW